MAEEEELFDQEVPLRIIGICMSKLKPFLYSLSEAKKVTAIIGDAGLDQLTAAKTILYKYLNGDPSRIENKLSELAKARDLTNLLILALDQLKSDQPPSGDVVKSSEAGQILYRLEGKEGMSSDACRKKIKALCDRKDNKKLLARGPKR